MAPVPLASGTPSALALVSGAALALAGVAVARHLLARGGPAPRLDTALAVAGPGALVIAIGAVAVLVLPSHLVEATAVAAAVVGFCVGGALVSLVPALRLREFGRSTVAKPAMAGADVAIVASIVWAVVSAGVRSRDDSLASLAGVALGLGIGCAVLGAAVFLTFGVAAIAWRRWRPRAAPDRDDA